MTATYYAIFEYDKLTQTKGDIIIEGIVRNSEDTIYPRQEVDIEELPYECELHHFKADGYGIKFCDFVVTREFVIQHRTSGLR